MGADWRRDRARAGFTLAELMMVTAISAIGLASILATFLAFARGSESVGTYVKMSAQGREVLERCARDMRAATDVEEATVNRLRVRLPDGDVYDGESIEYVFDDAAGEFRRIKREQDGTLVSDNALLENVATLELKYYGPLGDSLSTSSSSLLLSIKSIQIDAKLSRDVSDVEATDYIITARYMMRNRPVTE